MTAAQPTHVPPPTTPGAAPPGPARRPAGGRALTVVGGVLAALLLALGVVQVLASMFARTTSAVATLAATDVVELVADGEVLVTVSAVDDVRVERVAQIGRASCRERVSNCV